MSRENRYLPENRAQSRRYTTGEILSAAASGEILAGRVALCDRERNLHIDLGCMRGIIPKNECAMGIEEGDCAESAILSRVGRVVRFQVLEAETKGAPLAVLSRRRVQERCRREYVDRLALGDVIEAAVTRLESFGAFCDVGEGIPALLPIAFLSVSRIPHPAARLRVGQSIRAVVQARDERGRLTLSMKELLGTWLQNAALFSPGQTVPGVVRSVAPYGIFVELTPNLSGLCEKTDGVREGDGAAVFIKSLLPEKMKCKLLLVDTFPPPPPQEPRYFFTGGHMDAFYYSPPGCEKRVETVFGQP